MTAVKKATEKARERPAMKSNVVYAHCFVRQAQGSDSDELREEEVVKNITRLAGQARRIVEEEFSPSATTSVLLKNMDALSEAALVFWEVIWELERDNQSSRDQCSALLAQTADALENARTSVSLLEEQLSPSVDSPTSSDAGYPQGSKAVSVRLPARSTRVAADEEDAMLAPGHARGRSDAVSAAPLHVHEPPKPPASMTDMSEKDHENTIPEASFDDLDLTDPAQFKIWQERVRKMGAYHRRLARERLIEMGVIREDGSLVSDELPPDMRPESKTSVETG